MTLGEYIRSERDDKGLSLREFATKLKCSAPFLYDIELGRRHPSDELFIKIAAELGISKKKLEEYDTRPPTRTMRSHIQSNPHYALAFRKMIDSGITPERMIQIVNHEKGKKTKS